MVENPIIVWLKMRSFPSHRITFFTLMQNRDVQYLQNEKKKWMKWMKRKNEMMNENWYDITLTLTHFFVSWFRWKLSLWRPLFYFGILTINPEFITSNNPFNHIYIISFAVIQCCYRPKMARTMITTNNFMTLYCWRLGPADVVETL